MSQFDQPSSPLNPFELSLKKEAAENLNVLFDEAERALEKEGREKAITLLPAIYDALILLNRRDKTNRQTIWVWNPQGNLTQEEFNRLNRRRKLLSNAIGIMTKNGIRHDLNEI